MDDRDKPDTTEGQTRSGQYRENVVNFSRRKGRLMSAAAASMHWGSGFPEGWPTTPTEANEVKDLIENQVAASARLSGQVGRLEGQMESVQTRLDHNDVANRRLQETMDNMVASINRMEEQRRSTMAAVKVVWAVVLAVVAGAGWLISHLGIGKP